MSLHECYRYLFRKTEQQQPPPKTQPTNQTKKPTPPQNPNQTFWEIKPFRNHLEGRVRQWQACPEMTLKYSSSGLLKEAMALKPIECVWLWTYSAKPHQG